MSENNSVNQPWKTEITEIKPDLIRIHGYSISSLMRNCSFAESVYLLLTGELPDKRKAALMEMMMVACIDHGVTPPSALAALTAASTGAPYNSALAAGILSINEHHGGAIENTMRMLMDLYGDQDGGVNGGLSESSTLQERAEELVQKYRENGRRLPGFGHRIHRNDPRTEVLFQYAAEKKIGGKWTGAVDAVSAAAEKILGRKLPVNVDGAIAALLLELDVPPELANSFFIISRVPGLAAHIHEEKMKQRPMRKIDPVNHVYSGKEPREIT